MLLYRVDGVDVAQETEETKQQPGNILGCCLVSLHFLCDVHSIHPVVDYSTLAQGG